MSNIIYIGNCKANKGLREETKSILDCTIHLPTYQRVTLDNGVKVYVMVLKNGKEYIVTPGMGAVRPLSYTQKTVIARRWVSYQEVQQWLGRE